MRDTENFRLPFFARFLSEDSSQGEQSKGCMPGLYILFDSKSSVIAAFKLDQTRPDQALLRLKQTLGLTGVVYKTQLVLNFVNLLKCRRAIHTQKDIPNLISPLL